MMSVDLYSKISLAFLRLFWGGNKDLLLIIPNIFGETSKMKAYVNISNIQMLDIIWSQLQNSTVFFFFLSVTLYFLHWTMNRGINFWPDMIITSSPCVIASKPLLHRELNGKLQGRSVRNAERSHLTCVLSMLEIVSCRNGNSEADIGF